MVYKNPLLQRIDNIKTNLKINYVVYHKNFNCSKLDLKYNGPFRMSEIGKKGAWIKLKGCKNWFHINQLKF